MIKTLVADIISSYVGHNTIPTEALPELISAVYLALEKAAAPPKEDQPLTPAVPVKRSVFPEYIICLEDGKRLKMLKRHLKTSFNMTPDEYRQKWSLPRDYPMVAPAYAHTRSSLARSAGLGRKRGRQPDEQPGFEDPTLVPDFAQEPKDEPHVTRVKEGRRGKAKRVT